MSENQRRQNRAIRYSEAFKMEIVRELESNDLSFAHIQRKYGIKGCATVQRWAGQYGNGTRGKVIRVEKPGEINEGRRRRERVRRMETALAEGDLDLSLRRAYTRTRFRNAGSKTGAKVNDQTYDHAR